MNKPAQKMKFSIKDFFSKCDQIRSFLFDMVTFTEKIFNGKLHIVQCNRVIHGKICWKSHINILR